MLKSALNARLCHMQELLAVLPGAVASIVQTIMEAIRDKDLKTLERLAQICPTPAMIELHAAAVRADQLAKAERELGNS